MPIVRSMKRKSGAIFKSRKLCEKAVVTNYFTGYNEYRVDMDLWLEDVKCMNLESYFM